MPPETKPVISSLADMTCENCVYSIRGEELTINPGQSDEHTVNRADCYLDNWGMTVRTNRDFCLSGKWLVNREVETHRDDSMMRVRFEKLDIITDYDSCYLMFGRAKNEIHGHKTT